ncbi:putative transcription factor MYB-HB-like family [Helianthus anomalus]
MEGMMGWRVAEEGWRKGPWTPAEDKLLMDYVALHGEGRWSSVAGCSGLRRNGKSCRLRWVNYLRPGLKKGQLSPQEEGIIIELHALWGNKVIGFYPLSIGYLSLSPPTITLTPVTPNLILNVFCHHVVN